MLKKYRWLSILTIIIMLVSIFPAVVFAVESPEYAFIPNSGEASVSKVDLLSMTEVARYYTEPRVSATADKNWRTSRIAQDVNGNAFVLNTGADGTNLQGSVARIQADTTGLITHSYPDPVLAFGTDQAVQVMNVGVPGEIPRAIAIDDAGFIWIGFYSGGYLQKYSYNPAVPSLDPVGPQYRWGTDLEFYEIKIAPDGKLWISSRSSTPTVDGTPGVFCFDPNTGVFTREQTFVPYSLLIADDSTIYVTSYNNQLHIRNTAGVWSTKTLTGSSEDRGMAFDDLGKIWIASTVGTSGGTTVKSYVIATGLQGPTYTLTSGTTPVGIGMDSRGIMWAVCRSDAMAEGWLEGFDPETLTKVGAIQVGFRPYAYGDFVEPPRLASLGDFVWADTNRNGLQDQDEAGIPGVTVELYDSSHVLVGSTTTNASGFYSFIDLTPGDYYVKFILPNGYAFSPQDVGSDDALDSDANSGTGIAALTTLSAGENDMTWDAGMYQVYRFCGYKLNDATGKGLEGWTIILRDVAGAEIARTVTDANGKYCFSGLPAGTYSVEEVLQDGWQQVFPEDTHSITLPADLNLIENGSFEDGNTGFISEYDYVVDTGTQALWGEGDYAVGTDPYLYHYLWESFADHTTGQGKMMIINGEDGQSDKIVWKDTAAVEAGVDYTFSFWGATSYPEAYSTLEVYINDIYIDTYQAPEFLAEWTKYSVVWNSGSSVSAEIKLICNTLIHTGNDFALDDISLTAHNMDFRNVQVYDICGYKFRAGTTEGLADWTIKLYKKDDAGAYVEFATDVTDENGKYCFEDLLAGEYRVAEVIDDQIHWIQRFPVGGTHDIVLPAGASDCDALLGAEGALFYNFENEELYDLGGFKYNGDTQSGMSGWTINLYKWDSSAEDWFADPFDSTVTDEDGKYQFTGLQAGRYKIEEELKADWQQVLPTTGTYMLSLPAGATVGTTSLYNFTNVPTYDLCGYKINGDTQEGVAGWTINLYKWDSSAGDWSEKVFASDVTDADGKYCFENLLAGRYMIEEEARPGEWLQLLPTTGTYMISLPAGATVGTTNLYNFTNVPTYDLCGYKVNGDTQEVMPGWEIYLYKWDPVAGAWETEPFLTDITDEDGKYCFEDLLAGRYKIAEEQRPGEWLQLSPAAPGYHALSLPAGASDCEATRDDADAKFYDFVNAPLYDLCGTKYGVGLLDLDATDKPLAGWTINLYRWDASLRVPGWTYVTNDVTDADGKYCFLDLRAGQYKLVESYGSMNADGFWKTPDGKYWRPYDPTNGIIYVNLPGDDSDCDDPETYHNFFNQCFGKDTAWAYGSIRHTSIPNLTSTNWGWTIELGVLQGLPAGTIIKNDVPIYAGAGQNVLTKGYLVGHVDIIWDGTKVTWEITYVNGVVVTKVPQVYVGNTMLPIIKGKPTNSPGQFKYDPTKVDYTKTVYMAMHFDTYVPCGFPN